jgi:thiopeptide-type bacteriocin biosynthesis protein
VVALRRTRDPAPTTLDPRAARRSRSNDLLSLGEGWLSVAITVPPRLQNQALLHLPPLPGARLVYWLRYRTPELGPHLRLRAHTDSPEALADVQQAVSTWARTLAEEQLSDGLLYHQPYLRETQRYGGQDAIDRAETVFAADSTLALRVLGMGLAEDDRFHLAAHCIAATARTTDTEAAVRPKPLTADERHYRDALRPRTRAFTVPSHIAARLRAHQDALAAFGESVGRERQPAVSDLVHLHCNRLLGGTASAERIARSLALDLLHRHG